MGADIHIHCEYFKKKYWIKDDPGRWENCDIYAWNPDTETYEFEDIYQYRDYELFGVLAGVRSNELPQICEPKGLPKDISAKTQEEYNKFGGDAHTPSWLTLTELLQWKKDQKKKWKKLCKQCEVQVDAQHWSKWNKYIIDSNGYVVEQSDHHKLDYLIKLIKHEMKRIWSFEDDIRSKADEFRIVFWFDS